MWQSQAWDQSKAFQTTTGSGAAHICSAISYVRVLNCFPNHHQNVIFLGPLNPGSDHE
ncbi:hypothetical protein BHE74_00028375 [Ensete ventricosum]|nr:hypothetical protein GW17_00003836 [Ensete ventricosum]RWW64394.1 hypothetical protein BHE74_00028375 [Ensete ventricosum]RZS04992.1 hypothetical protein BHM03_00035415 [Ensete ventricosum]